MPNQSILHKPSTLNDFHRPQYHYAPKANWMNDPNGVVQWDGRYHLFYQHNPYGANHANMHWGHAVSDNLTHWEELPIAIAPTPNSADQGGIFSGCIVDVNGKPYAFYTGVNDDYSIQTQCLAVGSDDLATWEKYSGNPVLPAPPEEMGQISDFRDPFVWQQSDDNWYMAVGCRIEGVGGAVLLYQTDNLTDWEYLNPLFIGENAKSGVMYECPNFFPLDDKWVLIISSHIGHTTGTVLYWVGDFVDNKFIPEVEGVLDSGYYYAPLTHLDEKGRRIMWAWVREGRTAEQFVEAGWSGLQAFPRVLTLDEQHRLCMPPAEELATLRQTAHHYTADSFTPFVSENGLTVEIQAAFTINEHGYYGLDVAYSEDERVTIAYDNLTETLRITRTYGDNVVGCETNVQGLPHRLDDNELLQLHVLIDGSLIEVIANERTSVTTRFYPSTAEHTRTNVINAASLASMTIWEMPSIWQ